MCFIDSSNRLLADEGPVEPKKNARSQQTCQLFLLAVFAGLWFGGCFWEKATNPGENGDNQNNPETITERELDSMAVRVLMDENGMEAKEVSEYVTWSKDRITSLDLSNTQVKRIPDTINSLSQLRELRIVNTSLHSMPDSISKLSELRILNLSSNKLDSLPRDISFLRQLIEIDLSHNQLNSVDFNFAWLNNLLHFNLSHNNLKALPTGIGTTISLKILHLENNRIQVLDDSLTYLKNLKTLVLSRNRIKALPLNMVGLKHLNVLELSENELELLPADIIKMKSLKFLSISNNKLRALPDSIHKLDVLQSLHADGNRLQVLPPSLGQMRSLQILHLQNNLLTTLPYNLGNLSVLKELFLNDNLLTQLPYTINKLEKLEHLGLIGNKIPFLPLQIIQLEHLQNLVIDENDRMCAISYSQMKFIHPISNFKLPLCSLNADGLFPTYLENTRSNRIFGQSVFISQLDPKNAAQGIHPSGINATFFDLDGKIVARVEADSKGTFEAQLPRGTFTGGLTMRDSGQFTHRSICFDTLVLTNVNDSLSLGSFTFEDKGPKECDTSVYPPGTAFNLSIFGKPDTLLEIPYVNYPLDSSEVRYILRGHCNLRQSADITPSANFWHVTWGKKIKALEGNEFKIFPEFKAEVSRSQTVRTLTCEMSPSPVLDKKDNDGDGCVDEEVLDGKDNDGDGLIDEDPRQHYFDDNNNKLTVAALLHPDSSGMGQLLVNEEDRLVFTLADDFWVDSVYNTNKRMTVLSYGISPAHDVHSEINYAQQTVGGCWHFYDSLFKPVRFAVSRFDGKDTVMDLHGIQFPLDSISAAKAAKNACNTNLNSAFRTYSNQRWLFTWGDSLLSLTDSGFTRIPEFQIVANANTPEINCKLAPSQKADGMDNDGDGCLDEERLDSLDNDGDGIIDEDLGLSAYNATYFNSLLNPDSLSGEKLVVDSAGRLEFTKADTFWAVGGLLPEYRRDILKYNLKPDNTNGPELDTAVQKIGGCWKFYRSFFK